MSQSLEEIKRDQRPGYLSHVESKEMLDGKVRSIRMRPKAHALSYGPMHQSRMLEALAGHVISHSGWDWGQ